MRDTQITKNLHREKGEKKVFQFIIFYNMWMLLTLKVYLLWCVRYFNHANKYDITDLTEGPNLDFFSSSSNSSNLIIHNLAIASVHNLRFPADHGIEIGEIEECIKFGQSCFIRQIRLWLPFSWQNISPKLLRGALYLCSWASEKYPLSFAEWWEWTSHLLQ